MNYKKRFFKLLCNSCNLDNDCYCQDKSQKSVDNCGMDKVVRTNKRIQDDLKKGLFAPNSVDYFNED